MLNETINNLDFQQEKRVEMEQEIVEEEYDTCSICGHIIFPHQYVYKNQDNTYSHTDCIKSEIDDESIRFSEILEFRRERNSTEEVF